MCDSFKCICDVSYEIKLCGYVTHSSIYVMCVLFEYIRDV